VSRRGPTPQQPPPFAVTRTADAVTFAVRVSPRAKTTSVLGVHADALKLAVTAPPDKGKANAAVTALLADALGLPKSAVAVIAGATSRTKRVRISPPPTDGSLRALVPRND
jgi:uncharacterized protein (TIGR00251 family)